MNTKITLNIGLGFDKSGNAIPKERADAAVVLLRGIATRLAGGCTLWRAEGAWGTVVEPVLVLEVVVSEEHQPSQPVAQELADAAKAVLGQECVAVSFQLVKFSLF